MEVQNNNYKLNEGFVVLRFNNVYLLNRPEDLHEAMTGNNGGIVEAFSTPSFEEARCLITQRYPQMFHSLTCCFNYSPLSIPAGGPFALRRPDPVIPETNPLAALGIWRETTPKYEQGVEKYSNVAQYFWGITFASGFAIEVNSERVVNKLADARLLYAHALCFTDINAANAWARWDFTHRFFRRYDATTTTIQLPNFYLAPGYQFNDPNFEQREKDRAFSQQLTGLLEWGLL